jgi:hypothetical protein
MSAPEILTPEHRAQLDADIVTGRLDVREVALRLRDQGERPASESDESFSEEVIEDAALDAQPKEVEA